jgi:predicted Zn-dependent protease
MNIPKTMKKSLYTLAQISLLLALTTLFLHGCARHQRQYPPQHSIEQGPEQVGGPELEKKQEPTEERSMPGNRERTGRDQEDEIGLELKNQKGPAHSLFRDAEQALRLGEYKRAEMLLERALRVEPKNGWYWHAMGRVQYEQGSFEQAIQFCLKSNSLAGQDMTLRHKNQLLLDRSSNKTGKSLIK